MYLHSSFLWFGQITLIFSPFITTSKFAGGGESELCFLVTITICECETSCLFLPSASFWGGYALQYAWREKCTGTYNGKSKSHHITSLHLDSDIVTYYLCGSRAVAVEYDISSPFLYTSMFDHFASCYTLGSDPSLHQSDLSKYIYIYCMGFSGTHYLPTIETVLLHQYRQGSMRRSGLICHVESRQY